MVQAILDGSDYPGKSLFQLMGGKVKISSEIAPHGHNLGHNTVGRMNLLKSPKL
jgi:hypothetical protein